MPVTWDKAKGRWRFRFRRRFGGQRYQLTKLLPKGWSQRQAEEYDRKKCGSLYAEAAGIETPRLPIAGAIKLYLEHHVPKKRHPKQIARELSYLYPLIKDAYLDEIADLAAQYVKDNPQLAPASIHN